MGEGRVVFTGLINRMLVRFEPVGPVVLKGQSAMLRGS